MAAYFNIYGLFLFFNLLNLAVYGLVIAVACKNVIHSATNVIIYNSYTGSLCLLLLFAEFRLPSFVHEYLKFLCTYRGRGLLYTFFGCLVYAPSTFNIVACILVVSVGVAFFLLSWVPMAPPSFGLLDNWRAWTYQGTRNLYRNTTKADPHNSKYVDLTSHDHRRVADDILEYHEDQYMTDLRGEDIEMVKADLRRHPTASHLHRGVSMVHAPSLDHPHDFTQRHTLGETYVASATMPNGSASSTSSASSATANSSTGSAAVPPHVNNLARSLTAAPMTGGAHTNTLMTGPGATAAHFSTVAGSPPTWNRTNPFYPTLQATSTSLAIQDLAMELDRAYPLPLPPVAYNGDTHTSAAYRPLPDAFAADEEDDGDYDVGYDRAEGSEHAREMARAAAADAGLSATLALYSPSDAGRRGPVDAAAFDHPYLASSAHPDWSFRVPPTAAPLTSHSLEPTSTSDSDRTAVPTSSVLAEIQQAVFESSHMRDRGI
ncbi:hypothetical protein IWQ60_009823 [Tieghemiomyces parasiticus]|uniref:Uncharacterized protein n=1 Tax=Tieghemiomyces parasiticus TaxID=78921 RepID=A0A9W7ZSQ0_9FUNG|nr:hypothetical protein IWQ60_009823 [Tieghemiomyces parasiticus]